MTQAPTPNFVFLSGEAQPFKDPDRRYWVVQAEPNDTDEPTTGDFSDGCGEPVGNSSEDE